MQIRTLARNSNCSYQVKSCAKTVLRVAAVCQNATILYATTVGGGGAIITPPPQHRQLHHLKILKVFAELQLLAIYAGVIGSKLRVANTHPHSHRYSTVCLYNTLCIIMCYLGSADVSSLFSRFFWILLAKRTSRWGCLHLPFCSLCQPFYHPPLTQPHPPICMVCSVYRVNLDESRENFVAGKWHWNSGP